MKSKTKWEENENIKICLTDFKKNKWKRIQSSVINITVIVVYINVFF